MKSTTLAIAIAWLAVFAIIAPTEKAEAGGTKYCGNSHVVNLAEPAITGSILSGRGRVCVTPWGLHSSMTVRGLPAGSAYTVWWVYIDDTTLCQGTLAPFEPEGYAGPCGFKDFFDFAATPPENPANPLVVFGRMDSAIPRRNGRTRFSGSLRGMKPSSGSQVWLLLFGHGPAALNDGQQLARQLLTPEDPASGAPHLGIEGTMNAYPSSVVVIDLP
jgi:hypothetical protein